MWLTGRRQQAREIFFERTRGLTKNVDLGNVFRGKRIAPHGEVYRDIMLAMLRDGGLEVLRAQPWPLYVIVAGFPRWLPSALATVVGLSAYQLEKALRPRMLHPSFGRALSFRPDVFDMRDCESPDELAALVLASSATPPFTPVGLFRGRRYLDGGMVDNAPAFVADAIPGVTAQRRAAHAALRRSPPRRAGRAALRGATTAGPVRPVGLHAACDRRPRRRRGRPGGGGTRAAARRVPRDLVALSSFACASR